MNEDFVTYEQAVKLRECGFDWKCAEYIKVIPGTEREEWDEEEYQWCTIQDINRYPKATLWQAQKWLREVINMAVYVAPDIDEADIGDTPTPFPTGDWCYEIWFGDYTHIWPLNPYPTYEQALSAGIDAALELIEKKGEK